MAVNNKFTSYSLDPYYLLVHKPVSIRLLLQILGCKRLEGHKYNVCSYNYGKKNFDSAMEEFFNSDSFQCPIFGTNPWWYALHSMNKGWIERTESTTYCISLCFGTELTLTVLVFSCFTYLVSEIILVFFFKFILVS